MWDYGGWVMLGCGRMGCRDDGVWGMMGCGDDGVWG